MKSISVVIPTYNRRDQLSDVLRHIIESETYGFERIEVIVVDDGSEPSCQNIVDTIHAPDPFRLRYIYQENAGPAEARNRGFRLAAHEIVLFIDDDILVFPNLIRIHSDAHRNLPGSVVFGRCPFVKPEPQTASYRFLSSLGKEGTVGYERVDVVASGNLSVEKAMFMPEGVYRDGLRIPAAEEFELEQRLNEMEIPIYFSYEAVGWHLQPSTIADKCAQEFKYGVGAAEVWLKLPEIANNKHISTFLIENGYIDWTTDPTLRKVKKILKTILAVKLVRFASLKATIVLERFVSSDGLIFPIYRFLCGINLFAGVRNGLRRFNNYRRL